LLLRKSIGATGHSKTNFVQILPKLVEIILDSAVAIDATSDERTFHGEANSSLPLSGRRSSVVDWNLKTYNNRVRKQETTLRLHGWVSSLLQARPSLMLAIGSSAVSGIIPAI
jgi:hypothetical protein